MEHCEKHLTPVNVRLFPLLLLPPVMISLYLACLGPAFAGRTYPRLLNCKRYSADLKQSQETFLEEGRKGGRREEGRKRLHALHSFGSITIW